MTAAQVLQAGPGSKEMTEATLVHWTGGTTRGKKAKVVAIIRPERGKWLCVLREAAVGWCIERCRSHLF
ncbi:hypothetical protein Esti_006853 [Eimeria stiedai]